MNRLTPSALLLRLFLAPLLFLASCAVAGPRLPESADAVEPLWVGAQVPAVTVRSERGELVNLQTLSLAKPTIIVFYRGGWCKFCNRQLTDLEAIARPLAKTGFQLIAVSPDQPSKLTETRHQQKIGFPLYSDSSMAAAMAFKIAFRVDHETLEKYRDYGIDLEAASGKAHHLLPVPAVFFVGRDGRIARRFYDPNYTKRLEAEAILRTARDLAASGF